MSWPIPAIYTASTGSSATSAQPAGKDGKIVIDNYGGSKVLPELSMNPTHSKLLLQTLNAMKGVVTNVREVKVDDATIIVSAIVRDPSQRCLREGQRTQKESELKAAINSALKEAGIEVSRRDETIESESSEKLEAEGKTSR